MLIDLVLPYPPTVNTYWRRRGSTYFISEEGKRYRRAVALIVRQQRLKLSLSGRLAISTLLLFRLTVGGLLDRVLSLLYILFRPLLRAFLFKSLSFLSVKLRHPLFAEVRL